MESVYLETTYVSYLVSLPSRDVVIAVAPATDARMVEPSPRPVSLLRLPGGNRRGVGW